MFALLMLFFWQALVPVLIIALFFDVGYFFVGDFSKEDHAVPRVPSEPAQAPKKTMAPEVRNGENCLTTP